MGASIRTTQASPLPWPATLLLQHRVTTDVGYGAKDACAINGVRLLAAQPISFSVGEREIGGWLVVEEMDYVSLAPTRADAPRPSR